MSSMSTIQSAKKLLREVCIKFNFNNKDIMQGVRGEEAHVLDVLRWVEKLNPKASVSLKLAALFHDIDRVITPKVGGGFKGDRNSKKYLRHKKDHARRSAEFIIPLLKKNKIANGATLKKARFLIVHHDDTGEEVAKINDSELNYLVSADSFAFFTSIAPKLFKAEGKERIKDKIRFMTDKLPDFARRLLRKQQLKNNIFNDLKNEIIGEYYVLNNPRDEEYKFCPTCSAKLARNRVDGKKLLSCSKCGFVFWNNPKPVVSVIIKKTNKVLLLKRAREPLKDYWCLPGGYVNYSEKPEEAAIRETKEETGLDVEIKKLICVYQINNDPRGINLDIIYTGSVAGGKIKTNTEISEFKYFSANKLPELIAYKHRAVINLDNKNNLYI